MLPELQPSFDGIERQRLVLQDRVAALSGEQWDWSPDDASWSVGQIVQHLVLSDETLGRVYSGSAAAPEPWMFRLLPRAMRRALIRRALQRDIALPLPSPSVEPSGRLPRSELLPRWETARRGMREDLEALRGGEAPYRHPVLGPLTAAQMLDLAEAHTAYHARQIAARQRERSFPA